ncbi:MAG TPA: diaminopimelate decarboxylase [Candidatus Baltobacteraceae bacterium]|jgi:diaminopimelate decarboxylase|nr:diaminopimelate decarboxylase [Candidatus Baltobacteraceae bacterium]
MQLFPGQGRSDGQLMIGGVRAQELAQAYGTPLLAIDYDVLDGSIAAFSQACAPHGIEIAYAGKALLLVALARHLKHTPLDLDVCSLGELRTAERAAFPAERMRMHGCGKTDEELEAAAAGRVGRIIVDNIWELTRLARYGPGRERIRVLIRINTGIEAHTHDFVRTSGEHSKFGFDPAALSEIVPVLQRSARLEFRGLHSHIGSQIYEREAFAENARVLMERAGSLAAAGLVAQELIVGGGFGVAAQPDGETLDLAAIMDAVAQTVREHAYAAGIPAPHVGIEPGRALIAQAGTSLYSVMARKEQFGRKYAIVDGGVYENPRPALYDAYHHIICASREAAEPVETAVCGRTCENDRLGVAELPRDLRAGDLIAMCTTGAYTYSMASNYNRFTRPAVIAVRQGTHELIARRETIEDVLRSDCDV